MYANTEIHWKKGQYTYEHKNITNSMSGLKFVSKHLKKNDI